MSIRRIPVSEADPRLDMPGLSLRRLPHVVTEIAAFRGERKRLAEALGVALPQPGSFVGTKAGTLLAYRPECWLLLKPSGPEDSEALAASPSWSAFAAIIDQSHGKKVFALQGVKACDLLMRGCRLDLREKAFPTGSTGTTIIGQITVTLLCDAPGEHYRLIVGSTFASAFVDWITRTAAHLPA
jgi:heterotetrameric sarcosine oxidase gamma subunit